ncbi:hypothetical protein A6V39_03135 [Candidatus Mycoplasma haematobovis]|uniref:Uncharacterized protein n=1 Tax=Candidatus Mycoplasma haematobovis TaxID=432608 RepID=A0A1A9QD69_9MOLU|nr:hypothetical protein [Candidatus Mycoplasma haematobovis]OAL10403.1 hypothetical protein A6V39_03135 [Candidatus Mycoplasma haematobovis]
MNIWVKGLIGVGTLGAIVTGVLLYPKPKKIAFNYEDFWGKKLKVLETELVKLNKEGKDEVELAKKIATGRSYVLFALNQEKTGFYPGNGTQQKTELSGFCADSERRKTVEESTTKKICDEDG